MKRPIHHASPASQQGSVLLEAMIAILIFSMGVLAVVGLQAAMIKSTSDAKYRAEASFIAQQRLGTMWANPNNLADYAENLTDISTLLPNGTRTVEIPVAGQIRVTVSWQQPGQDAHTFIANARIAGG